MVPQNAYSIWMHTLQREIQTFNALVWESDHKWFLVVWVSIYENTHKWREYITVSLLLWFHYPYSAHSMMPYVHHNLWLQPVLLRFCTLPSPIWPTEVYLYNCPCRYQMRIWGGAGAPGISLSSNLLAFGPFILLEASTAGLLCLPTV